MVFRPLTLAAVVSAALPLLVGAPAFGQTMIISDPQSPAAPREQPQEYTLMHVNADSGSDTSGDGSQLRPFQTVSHALDVAEPSTVILLAPGEYSADSGEVFPLRLQPGVTVQGAVGTGLGGTVIRGNGTLAAANGTYMQVAVVGVDGAGLANVTVTNPSSSGYGLVVESGRPILRFNGFVGSGYAGAYVGGTAEPLFEQNVFSENGSVGLLLADQSRAEVVANTFQNTGTGIQVAPGAEPRISQNRIVSNRQGIVMAANAQPQLQGNEIARNRQNGLIEFTAAAKTEAAVAVSTTTAPQPLAAPSGLASPPATPTAVGSSVSAPPSLRASPRSGRATSLPSPPANPGPRDAATPGEGVPPANAPAEDADEAPPAASGSIAPEEPLSVAVPDAVMPNAEAPDAVGPGAVESDATEPAAAAPESAEPDAIVSPSPEPVAIAPPATDSPVVPPEAAAPEVAPAEATNQAEGSADPALVGEVRAAEAQQLRDLNLPLSVPLASALDSPPEEDLQAVNPTPQPQPVEPAESVAEPGAVVPPSPSTVARSTAEPAAEAEPTVPDPSAVDATEREPASNPPTLPEAAPEGELLRVPEGNIPAGRGANQIPVLAATGDGNTPELTASEPPPPPSRASMLGLAYRVVVAAADSASQAEIRAIVPDAFRVEVDDQTMMQVGAYPTEAEATAMLEALRQQGVEAEILHIP